MISLYLSLYLASSPRYFPLLSDVLCSPPGQVPAEHSAHSHRPLRPRGRTCRHRQGVARVPTTILPIVSGELTAVERSGRERERERDCERDCCQLSSLLQPRIGCSVCNVPPVALRPPLPRPPPPTEVRFGRAGISGHLALSSSNSDLRLDHSRHRMAVTPSEGLEELVRRSGGRHQFAATAAP